MTDPFDTVLEGLRDNANDRKYEAALSALASIEERLKEAERLLEIEQERGVVRRIRAEAAERERDHHEKRADNAFDLAKMSEERLEAAEQEARVNLQNAEANWKRCMDAEWERDEWKCQYIERDQYEHPRLR